jgi:hypothetical protein
MKAAETQGQAMGLLLAGSLCVLPFLLPYHQLPVLTFHAEWLAAMLGIAASLAALAGRAVPSVSLPVPARWLLAFALFLSAQAAFGDPAYPQLPLLAALYVVFAVLMIWLGAQLAHTFGTERVVEVLATFLLAGALLTASAGLLQFYGLPALLEDFVAELHGSRAYGNIAQANLYANYLAVGEGALLFLWVRKRVPIACALPVLILLVVGSVLSGSRSSLLYPLWFAGLASLARVDQRYGEAHRLRLAAYGTAIMTLAAHVLVPWLNISFDLGPPSAGTLDRLFASSEESADPRPHAWLLALKIFAGAPVFGVGVGEFARAAFDLGLDRSLVLKGELWTSPHNLPLHLLAETGLVGAAVVIVGLCAWAYPAARRYRGDGQPALWWIIAAFGVEMIHSMIEYPLWNAHFLGVTALLMGTSTATGSGFLRRPRPFRIIAATACAALALVSLTLLRDYLRLDAVRIPGTKTTLAPEVEAQVDAAIMNELTRGLMAPLAEFWILTGTDLNRNDLAAKSAMAARVARFWPSQEVMVRRAVFLAFTGETSQAQALVTNALRTFPHRRDSTVLLLQRASATDPPAIEPLLRLATPTRPPAG